MITSRMPVTVTSAEQARSIAREWQSPGTIGRHLATLASGIAVSGEDLLHDIDATITSDKPAGLDLERLEALRFWVTTAQEDWVVFTTRPMLPCGCFPHRTTMSGVWGTFYCLTEQQGYCNFECECEDQP